MQLFGIDSEHDRLRLRALRASPPGLAAKREGRRRVFAAALGQFDELLTAAGVVGPVSAPLPLYYAINQAGRAVGAAYQPDPGRWQPRWHGLIVRDPKSSLQSTIVEPLPRSPNVFTIMAERVGSPLLTAPVRLGALWAAAPGAEQVEGLGGSYSPAAPLRPFGGGMPTLNVRMGGPKLAGSPDRKAIRARLERAYPAARSGMTIVAVQRQVGQADPTEVILNWSTPAGVLRTADDVAACFPAPDGALYLMPGLGTNDDELAPLMVWWALLFALSHLARYQPAAWTEALDPVRSTLAVPIETTLAFAREVMPHLIYHELVRT